MRKVDTNKRLRRLFFLSGLAIAVSTCALAADFSLSITSAPKKVPQGAPISVTVELKNVSGHPVTVAKGCGGFEYTLNIVRADGIQRAGCKPPPVATYIPGFKKETLPADWCKTRVEDITCDDVPGEWIVQALISCQGPYPIYERGQIVGQFNGWSGELKSEEARIVVVKPRGVDLEAYNYFKGCPRCNKKEVLRLFPTSTYSAYVVFNIMHGFMQGNKSMLLRSVEKGSYLSNSYPDDTGKSKDGWCSLKGEAAANWWSKWINIILTNHPDIWFADQLRLKRAVDQVALKNYQAGAADLKTLSQEATPEVAQKAKEMLDMMKSKGWIKKQPEAPKQ